MRNIPTKSPGDTLTADEFNDIPTEMENVITSTGIALSSGDLTQMCQAMVNYVGNGNFYTDSGSSTAYVLSAISSNHETPAYANGQLVRFIATNTNTTASPTVKVGALAAITITDTAGQPIGIGDIQSGSVVELSYHAASVRFFLFEVFRARDADELGGQVPSFYTDVGNATGGLLSNSHLPVSTDTVSGTVELATDAETQTGTDATRAVTPSNLSNTSTTNKGIIELATDAETQTGTDATRAVTPESLASFPSSHVASGGYQELPGGLIIQWGTVVVGDIAGGGGGQGVAVVFPTAFGTVFNVFGINNDVSATSTLTIRVTAKSTTGATLNFQETISSTQSVTLDWMAIGI